MADRFESDDVLIVDYGAVQRRFVAVDVLRERVGNLGGFRRSEPRGGFWVDRDDVLAIIDELTGEQP